MKQHVFNMAIPLIALAASLGLSESLKASESIEPQPMDNTAHHLNSSAFDIELQHERQNLDSGDGKLTSLLFSPSLSSLRANRHSWSLGVDIPLQQVKGTFAYNIPLNVANACGLLMAGEINPQRQFFIRRLTELCAEYADEDYHTTGMGDITLYAQYAYYNDSDWTPSSAISYKLDNAEYDEFLGSGTEELNISASLLGNHKYVATSFYIGRTLFMGGNLESFYDDYTQVEFSLRTPWRMKWDIGTSIGYQNPNGVDVTNTSVFGGIRLGERSRLSLEYTQYQGDDYAIDSEISASVSIYF